MATESASYEAEMLARRSGDSPPQGVWVAACRALASLRLTVALFAAAIFIIHVGTLAQVNLNMWEVISAYFRAGISWVDVGVFFPRSWFPSLQEPAMRALVALAVASAGAAGAIPCFGRAGRSLGKSRKITYRGGRMAASTREGDSPIFAPQSLRENRDSPRSLVCYFLGLALGWRLSGWGVAALAAATAMEIVVWGGFFFPRGALIGSMLAANLLAAHYVRFRIQTRGGRLVVGVAVLALGALLTWLVVAAGHNREGIQAEPFFRWSILWLVCKVGIGLLWLALTGAMIFLLPAVRRRTLEVAILGGSSLLLGALSAWLWLGGEAAYLGDAGMRILWQLMQSEAAAAVLLIGCILVFKRRGGMVLIHAGLGLLMLGEWFVSWYAVEQRMTIQEGQTVNYAEDIRQTELAVTGISKSRATDDVVTIPRARLLRSAATGSTIRHEALPFDVQVVRYMKNSDIRQPKPGWDNPATDGKGLAYAAKEVPGSGGADSSGTVDVASAYVRFLDKRGGQPIGTYLLSQHQLIGPSETGSSPTLLDFSEEILVGRKAYDVALRFKRTYKPYSLRLIDFRKDDYVGTSIAMNYSSDVHLTDPTRGVDREVRIWMNNPLRYAGETFYQSSYRTDLVTGKETTILQVVTNTGWMIPYVSCMLVVTGMLAHFWTTLVRFLRRRADQRAAEQAVPAELVKAAHGPDSKGERRGVGKGGEDPPVEGRRGRMAAVLLPAAIVLMGAVWIAGKATSPPPAPDGFLLEEFGKLPVVFEGRVKPFDTLARNTLRTISDRDTFRDERGQPQPAVRWLLDAIARPDEADKHRVFRIYDLDILHVLGLERRRGFRYSLGEIRGSGDRTRPELAEFDRQVQQAQRTDAEKRSTYQRNVLEATRRFQSYLRLTAAFQPRGLPPLPTDEQQDDRQAALHAWIQQVMAAVSQEQQELERMQVPLAVPVRPEDGDGQPSWLPYATACSKASLQRNILHQEPDPAVMSLFAIFDAYGKGDARTFNGEVVGYRRWLAEHPPGRLDARKVAVEAFYNRFAPLYYSMYLYGFAFVLAFGSCLGWSDVLGRTAFWLLVLALVVHSFGMLLRIYISGRPPVTNLYSSAVVIAWACVAFALILEAIFRVGWTNIVGAAGGLSALLVAQFLGLRGDTFTVLQAVLDTQFWLALHVVAITLGYAATFVAGLLGIVYLVTGTFTRLLNEGRGEVLTRMIYGILCFAIFFSFWGTVLGGLWADDSWGRFWGWDPKENGALIIVLWNAIILHARWADMVKGRGLAMLAVGGNIVTSWSWFGVNELGVGLHSYGFTEGVRWTLCLFVLSQLAIIFLGAMAPSRVPAVRET